MGLVPKELPSSEMGGLGEPRQHSMLLFSMPFHMSRVIAVCTYALDKPSPITSSVPDVSWKKILVDEGRS
jgi:hypothetical protein